MKGEILLFFRFRWYQALILCRSRQKTHPHTGSCRCSKSVPATGRTVLARLPLPRLSRPGIDFCFPLRSIDRDRRDSISKSCQICSHHSVLFWPRPYGNAGSRPDPSVRPPVRTFRAAESGIEEPRFRITILPLVPFLFSSSSPRYLVRCSHSFSAPYFFYSLLSASQTGLDVTPERFLSQP